MTQTVQPDSKSLVLRSTHILLVEVVAAKPGEWAPSKPGLKSRRVELSLQIAEVLRGKLDPIPDGPVPVTITQTDYAGELMMQPLPGPWPPEDLMPGTALVVFATSGDDRVEHIFSEPGCQQVLPAGPVLPGLRIASKAEKENLPLADTLALASPQSDKLDPLFAGFLWGRYGSQAMASQPEFNLLAEFTERKGLEDGTRQALVKDGYDRVKAEGDDTPERAQRLALAMCRVLLMSEAAELHENLIETYLPNLLGISSELPRQSASAVFRGHEGERTALKALLRRHGTDADATPLLKWLDSE